MNKKQRIVLIIGAIALIIIIITAPKVVIVQGSYLKPEKVTKPNLAPVVDFHGALIRVIGVIGATLLIFFAVKDSKEKRTQFIMSKESYLGEIHREDRGVKDHEEIKIIKKGILEKTLNFLRDFF